MAGGSPAPVDREDSASHINPLYDSDGDGRVEDADRIQGLGPNELRGFTRTDVAETFAESDVTLTHDNTKIAGESVDLANGRINSQHYTWSYDTFDRHTSSGIHGYEVTFTDGPFWGVYIRNNATASNTNAVQITDTNDNILAEQTNVGYGSVYFDGFNVQAGETYRFVVDVSGQEVDEPYGPPDPGADAPFTLDAEVRSGGGLVGAIGTYTRPTSGSVTVEWPEPLDILDWDSATYLADPDAGAVTVDVVDPSDGTVVMADIGRGADLSPLDPATNIAIRVSMTRPEPDADSPNLRACYRRWSV